MCELSCNNVRCEVSGEYSKYVTQCLAGWRDGQKWELRTSLETGTKMDTDGTYCRSFERIVSNPMQFAL